MSTETREKSSEGQLADVLAQLPDLKKISVTWFIGKEEEVRKIAIVVRLILPDLITVIEQFPAMLTEKESKLVEHIGSSAIYAACTCYGCNTVRRMLKRAKREAFEEAAKLCDGMGTMHGGTAQRIKRAIRELTEGKE